MAFHNVRFPDSIAEGAEGGPEFSTAIAESSGGYEQRNINWSTARRSWNVGTGIKDGDGVAELIAFFTLRYGRAYAFPFKDWQDYEIPRQSIGTTDGSDATWQLIKTYSDGTYSTNRKITKPVMSGTDLYPLKVWVNNVEIAQGVGTSQYQIDALTGIITLGATLAATTGQAIEAQAEFNVPCRFDSDRLPLRLNSFKIGEIPDIMIREDRE